MSSGHLFRNLLFFFLTLMPMFSSESLTRSPRIYMIGDSTMAQKNLEGGNPERGWGQLLPQYFKSEVKIENHAKDGRSTRSFFDEGLWTPIVSALQPGDWVIIQFGHNDQKKEKPKLYTDSNTDYRTFLTKYVEETRAKGAFPLLATSIYRCSFSEDGKPKPTLGAYPEAVRQCAALLQVPCVDLNEQTGTLLESFGPEKAKTLYLHFAPGALSFYPNGKSDNSHLSETGARLVSELFTTSLRAQKIPLASLLKEPSSN